MANESYNYRKRSLDDMQDHAMFSMRGFGNMEQSTDFSSESTFTSPQDNVYYSNTENRSSLPFMFRSEDVMPSVIGVANENFIYGSSNFDCNGKVPNNAMYVNQTNGNLSGVDYDFSDYNLFSSGGPARPFHTPPPESSTTPHLIQNLVGHWGTGGNYTPFGSSKNIGEIGSDRVVRKPRMVAEVRPMRPSYSDVLAKSVPNQNQKSGKLPADGKVKTNDLKNGKIAKSSISRTLSGSNGLGSRQGSQGDESSTKQLKAAALFWKKINQIKNGRTREEPLKKKWVSLDDLTAGVDENEFIQEASTKKGKITSSKKVKENWEPPQMSNGKAGGKQEKKISATPKVQSLNRDAFVNEKVEAVKTKPVIEERKAASKLGETSKPSRRSGKGPQAEKAKKAGKPRRRDGGWQAVVANRVDLALAWLFRAATWLITLVLDVFALSTHLSFYMCTSLWQTSVRSVSENYALAINWIRGIRIFQRFLSSRFWPFRRSTRQPASSDDDEENSDSDDGNGKKKKRLPGGLKHNLPLPSTGDEAMKRLLACKGKDPYSILGVSQDCTDDDIKKYYKRQAFLVHPDKNNQPGAEEAFKILVHAFDIIGEPEHRKSYDRSVEKTAQAEQAWSELSDLLAQLHKKMEYVANTLRCTNCGKRHKRSVINRPIYAARMCSQCNIHHSVREGDIWAETSVFGFMWRYFACMDGSVYDISEWAACQGGNLKNLKANTHQVQYRIVLGKNAQKARSQQTSNSSGEPDLDEFINNLYTKPEAGVGSDPAGEARSRKHRRKK